MSEKATVAGGCFWCTEAVFERVAGVESVVSGYAGGDVAEPTYDEVCSGTTGHAECVQITYDPEAVTCEDLLTVHFATHDPTTKDREGPDVGSQYRSAVFTHDENQKERVASFIEELAATFDDPIVTEIEPLDVFYPAEEYHQDYYANNPNHGYCTVNIDPKIQKLRNRYQELLAT